MRRRVAGTTVVALVLCAAVFFYVVDFLTVTPPALSATVTNGTAHLTLQTVGTYGRSPDPDWVSYLAQDSNGHWVHTTIYKVPAHTLVTVTVYEYDTQTGLRNPFLTQVRGTVGGVILINGKPTSVPNPNDAAHTFTIPDIGLSVPLQGILATAKNPCSVSPCSTSFDHNVIQFSFISPRKGTYRWQCFVPCAAGFYFGNGGPMQTIGWMSGELEVT